MPGDIAISGQRLKIFEPKLKLFGKDMNQDSIQSRVRNCNFFKNYYTFWITGSVFSPFNFFPAPTEPFSLPQDEIYMYII